MVSAAVDGGHRIAVAGYWEEEVTGSVGLPLVIYPLWWITPHPCPHSGPWVNPASHTANTNNKIKR